MPDTSHSLLERLQHADGEAWQRLMTLYTPLLRGWLRPHVLQDADCDDLIQEVLLRIVQEAPQFRHNNRPGAFRAWLRQMLVNRLREFWRRRPHTPVATGDTDFLFKLGQLEDPDSEPSRIWDQDHDRRVAARLLEMIEGDFEPLTWRAFRDVTVEGRRAAEVAAELGLSVNAVYIAKSRVMARLQQELAGLID
jgi:RNA polymerase sigma-70 factor (ECF subfamily)